MDGSRNGPNGIDITETPKSKGLFTTAMQRAYEAGEKKGQEEERESIEAIFKKYVPPHAMDLEDSVWLKRLLNKAFGHENIH